MNFKKTISFLLVIIILGFLSWRVFQDFDQIKNVQWEFNSKNLILLILTLLPGPFINALSWHLISKSLGGSVSFIENFKIWTYSNTARFLPGSIWQYAGRVYMLSKKGASKTLTTTALFLEAILNIAMASVIVLFTLNIHTLVLPSFLEKSLMPFILLALIAIIFLSGKRIAFLEKTLKTIFKRGGFKISGIRFQWLPVILLSVFTQFLLAGIALYFVISTVNISTSSITPFMGIYAAAWLVGYLTFLAPSGLGVREASIAGLMTSYASLSLGGIIAVLFRFGITLSEALTVFVVFLLTRKTSS